MNKIKRKGEIIPEKIKKEAINNSIEFLKEMGIEEIGMLKAEEILNFYLENIGEEIYNKGIEDSKKIISERSIDIEIDLENLKKD